MQQQLDVSKQKHNIKDDNLEYIINLISDSEYIKLDDLTEKIVAGATPRTSVDSYWENGTIPWMASGEIHKKRVYEVDKFITQEGYDNSSTKLVPKNSVLIALAGQGKTRGTVAINKIELCTNQSIATMIPNINKLDYNYLYYYLESKYDKLRLLSSSDGGRGGLNLKILKNLKIKNIPLETQQYISNFLLILDKKIELLEKTLVLYQKHEKYVKNTLFTQELKFNDDEQWVEHKIDDFIKEYKKKAEHNNYPILSSTLSGIFLQEDYFDKNVNSSDTSDYKVVPKGYFTYRSMSDTGVFKFNIQNIVPKGIISPAYPVFNTHNIDKYFLEQYLNNSVEIKKQILILKEGGTRYALGFNKFRKLNITIPSSSEQERISNLLKTLNHKISRLNKSLENLNKFKKGLLQKMFV